MKKSHDHTQLKRFAAISLVLVMSVAILATPASAIGCGGSLTGVGAWGANQSDIFDDYLSNYDVPSILGDIPAAVTYATGHTIVAIGDSLTAGATLVTPGVYTTDYAYPLQLSVLMCKDVINRGIGGDHSAGMLARYADDVLALDPDVVIIQASHNDIGRWGVEGSAANYMAMITPTLAAGAEVIMVTVPPCHYNDSYFLNMNNWIRGLNIVGVTVVDTWGELSTDNVLRPEYDSGDGIHLNEAGYAIIAQMILQDGFGGAPTNINKWIATADGVASNDANWHLGHKPISGEHILFDASVSASNCTWDYEIPDLGNIMLVGNGGSVIQDSVDIGYNDLIIRGWTWTPKSYHKQVCNGDITKYAGTVTENAWELTMANGGRITSNYKILFRSITINGDTDLASPLAWSCTNGALTISYGKTLHIVAGASLVVDYQPACVINNQGEITGDGYLHVKLYNSGNGGDKTISFGRVSCPVDIIGYSITNGDVTLTLGEDAVFGGPLRVYCDRVGYTMTLNCDNHNLSSPSIKSFTRGIILGGNGTITTAYWDSTIGGWNPEASTLVLLDGGSVHLADWQRINIFQVESKDGRTATWDMAASGIITATVTNLEANGTATWYIDDINQGDVRVDENGSIELSYLSSGIHELSVGPTQMTVAMDEMYTAMSIMIACALIGGIIAMVGRIKF